MRSTSLIAMGPSVVAHDLWGAGEAHRLDALFADRPVEEAVGAGDREQDADTRFLRPLEEGTGVGLARGREVASDGGRAEAGDEGSEVVRQAGGRPLLLQGGQQLAPLTELGAQRSFLVFGGARHATYSKRLVVAPGSLPDDIPDIRRVVQGLRGFHPRSRGYSATSPTPHDRFSLMTTRVTKAVCPLPDSAPDSSRRRRHSQGAASRRRQAGPRVRRRGAASAGLTDVLIVTGRNKGVSENHFARHTELEPDAARRKGDNQSLAPRRRIDPPRRHPLRPPGGPARPRARGSLRRPRSRRRTLRRAPRRRLLDPGGPLLSADDRRPGARFGGSVIALLEVPTPDRSSCTASRPSSRPTPTTSCASRVWSRSPRSPRPPRATSRSSAVTCSDPAIFYLLRVTPSRVLWQRDPADRRDPLRS